MSLPLTTQEQSLAQRRAVREAAKRIRMMLREARRSRNLQRNWLIWLMRRRGIRPNALARVFGLSGTRVGQIVDYRERVSRYRWNKGEPLGIECLQLRAHSLDAEEIYAHWQQIERRSAA